MKFQSTKTMLTGFSCAFRQWKADSHCRLIHGYALSFKFTFEAEQLDNKNWVVDFGSLKSLKSILEDTFDHTTVIAENDPELEYFKQGDALGVLKLVILPDGGCEKFAEYVFGVTNQWLNDFGYIPRCRLVSVEVNEHGQNSAIYSQ